MYLSGSGRSPEVRSPAEWFAAADQSWLVIPAYCGHFGVNLFFVISGFILALPFAKRAFNEQAAPGLKSYYLFRLRSAAARRSLLIASIVGFGLLSQCVIYPSGSARLRLAPLLVGLLYAGFFLGRLSNAFVRMRWIVIIGGMCYTIYLYHILISSNLMTKTMPLASITRSFNLDFAMQSLMILPVAFAACAALFIFAEKPFMRWSLSPRPVKDLEVAQVPERLWRKEHFLELYGAQFKQRPYRRLQSTSSSNTCHDLQIRTCGRRIAPTCSLFQPPGAKR